jgi:hypothetical protein
LQRHGGEERGEPATRLSAAGIQPSWTALNIVVVSASARKPSGSGVASARTTTRVPAAVGPPSAVN